jgi:hypothetical protein
METKYETAISKPIRRFGTGVSSEITPQRSTSPSRRSGEFSRDSSLPARRSDETSRDPPMSEESLKVYRALRALSPSRTPDPDESYNTKRRKIMAEIEEMENQIQKMTRMADELVEFLGRSLHDKIGRANVEYGITDNRYSVRFMFKGELVVWMIVLNKDKEIIHMHDITNPDPVAEPDIEDWLSVGSDGDIALANGKKPDMSINFKTGHVRYLVQTGENRNFRTMTISHAMSTPTSEIINEVKNLRIPYFLVENSNAGLKMMSKGIERKRKELSDLQRPSTS